jgi:general secretion pathway protein D
MIPRFVRLCIALLLAVGASGARAQTGPTPPPGAAAPAGTDGEMVSEVKLPDGDIDDAISLLKLLTGREVLRAAQLQTPPKGFSLVITKPILKSEAVLALQTVFMLNQIGVTELGDRFYVISNLIQTKTNAPEMITGSTLALPPSGKVATKVFELEFMRVQPDFQQIAASILTPNINGFVPFTSANAVMITDTVSNLQRVELLLQTVDKPNSAGLTPKFYSLHNATAANVVTKLRSMLTGTLQQQLGQSTTYNADERTNQLVLFSDPRIYPVFDDLIAKLDAAADPHTRNEVFPLKHAKSADVVTLLNQLMTGQIAAAQRANSQSVRPGQIAAPNPVVLNQPGVPGAPPAPTVISANNSANATEGTSTTNEFSSLMVIASDVRSNSVVVSGTVQDIVLMKDLVAKLDVVLAQVRIEVVIAEVTLDDATTSGISALGLKLDGDRLIGFSGSAAGLGVSGTGAASATGATAPDFATISRIGGPGSLGRSLDLTGIVSIGTTPRKNNTTILTVPAITTTHGKPGKIIDGETRPVITGTTTTTGAGTPATQATFTQQNIGTTLTVTPLIGNDGSVELDITTDLSDVTGNVTVGTDTQYIIANRSTASYITAKSGEIIVMAGFRKTIDSKSTNRLGPIPFLGDLFGSRTKDKRQVELIFFLRPTILTNDSTADNAPILKRVDELPTKDQIRREIDPTYVSPKPSILQQILRK